MISTCFSTKVTAIWSGNLVHESEHFSALKNKVIEKLRELLSKNILKHQFHFCVVLT